ncbi:MAG: NAD-dependent epimerase/dehydratase family protein [Acholeplasmataceae bacterium]|jgi:dihydroflavonol-4-reductase
MKVMLIGGTGLLGFETAKILAKNNHKIISFALPPKPKYLDIPKNMELILENYTNIKDEDLLKYMKGCEGLVFAAGIDERVEGPKPIYDLYYQHNIQPLKRLLPLAKKAGIKNVVILGSYFSYFNKIWPELELEKHHPYIKSRVDQEKLAFSFVDTNFNVAVVEIPYVFGIQEGRQPVWTILVGEILKMKRRTYWTKGGTTMITARQAGEAIYGALMKNKGANSYPIGYYNMTWTEMLEIFHEALDRKKHKITIIPNFLYKIYARKLTRINNKNNIESGLNLIKFSDLQSKKQFIDPEISVKLGVTPDDIRKEIINSVTLSREVLIKKDLKLTKMKYE